MRHAVMIVCLFAATSAVAQQGSKVGRDQQQEAPAPASTSQPTGRVADAGNGEIGQRQTRQETAPSINALERIKSRIANRVQNRIRSRIDTTYDPQANATSPFVVADDQARLKRRTGAR
jgi:hypothetical protein